MVSCMHLDSTFDIFRRCVAKGALPNAPIEEIRPEALNSDEFVGRCKAIALRGTIMPKG